MKELEIRLGPMWLSEEIVQDLPMAVKFLLQDTEYGIFFFDKAKDIKYETKIKTKTVIRSESLYYIRVFGHVEDKEYLFWKLKFT